MESTTARLSSLDTLRGLDMLIILGLDALVYALYPLHTGSEGWQVLREQMGHAPWDGLRLYDCVFPLFVYISGMAMSFSQMKRMGSPAWRQLLHMWWRAAILVLLGMLVNGAISWNLSNMRCASVLGLIGISGALAGSLMLLFRGRLAAGLILAGLILGSVGAAQHLCGDYTQAGCLNAKIDAEYCPGILHGRIYDPEGPLCIISATALSLLGYCSGRWFMQLAGAWRRALTLCFAGIVLLTAGCFLPCIKNIWTPGFVLCSAGIGAIAISILHVLIDLPGLHKVTLPLRVIGMNALAIYVLTHIINFQALGARLLGGTWALFLAPEYLPAANALTAILLAWGLCLFLYRKRVFIKL